MKIFKVLAALLLTLLPIYGNAAISVLQEQSAVSIATIQNVTNITQATSAVVTVNTGGGSNPFTVGQFLFFQNVVGMTQINQLIGQITAVGGSTGAWTATVNINSTGFTAYASAGNVNICLTSQSVTLTGVTAGSSFHVMGISSGQNSLTLSVADGTNTYSAPLDAITNGFWIQGSQFTADGVAAGSITITVTPSGPASAGLGIWVREIGGTSGADSGKHNSLLTASTVLTTDGLVGTAVTPSVAPGLVSSFAVWINGATNFGTQVPASGTGFTLGTQSFGIPNATGTSESLVYPAATSQTATFTAPTAGQVDGVWTVLFKQSGGGSQVHCRASRGNVFSLG